MADELICSECGKEIGSVDELEREGTDGIEVEEGSSISLYGNDDLFLCESYKKPLGVGCS